MRRNSCIDEEMLVSQVELCSLGFYRYVFNFFLNLEPQPPGNPRACPDLYRDFFTFSIINVNRYLLR